MTTRSAFDSPGAGVREEGTFEMRGHGPMRITSRGNQTLGDIYEQVSITMPPANPGGLAPDGYASVLR